MFEKLSKMLKIFKFAAESKLKDGTSIYIDGDLSEGTKIFVITSEGNLPLPDGTYELEDGMMISVEGGVITGVQEPVGEEETVEVEQSEEVVEPVVDEVETEVKEDDEEEVEEIDVDKKIKDLSELVNELLNRLKILEGSSADLSKQNDELKKQNENFSKQIGDFQKKLENTKGAEPIKKKVETTSFNYSNKRLQALKSFNG